MKISADRKTRYLQKMGWIANKIEQLPDTEAVERDEFYRDALYYRIQTSIEAVMDIIAMLCKDLGLVVQDDYSNISLLSAKRILNHELASELVKLNGLRNILVHKYNGIEDEIIQSSLTDIVQTFNKFLEVVNNLLE